MKYKHIISFAIITMLLSPVVVLAHSEEDEHAEHEEHAASSMQDNHQHHKTINESLAELDKSFLEISKAVNEKRYADIHALTETMTESSDYIVEHISTDKKARVSGSAKNIATLADLLHDAADKDDSVQVELQFKKLDGMIKVFHSQVGSH